MVGYLIINIISLPLNKYMDQDKIKKLKGLLERADKAAPGEIKQEAEEFLKTIDANELIMAEQALIKEGLAPESLRHLCPAHMDLLKDQLGDLKSTLPKDHPIYTFMSEHDEILKFLDQLEVKNKQAQAIGEVDDFSKDDREALKQLAHNLEAAEPHHQREEDVLFPAIEERGVYGPTEIMRAEHIDLRAHKNQLKALADNEISDFVNFKKELDRIAKFLVFNLRDHIFKENNILYPAALDVIKDQKDWDVIKEKCDKIGYCSFTPGINPGEGDITVLDLRTMPPVARHAKIFEIWDKSTAGGRIKIINDHDPKPLYYQFEAEHKGKFGWEYLENGPVNWAVIITKL